MPCGCAALNCSGKSTQPNVSFFRFPRDPGRCQKWVENCRRRDLQEKTPDQLYQHYRLCEHHFEDSMVRRTNTYRTVLRENAIPTIFDLTSHIGKPGKRKKRIKELIVEEIRTPKERKHAPVLPLQEIHEANNPDVEIQIEIEDSEESTPMTDEERHRKDYIKALFEIVLLMGEQNVDLEGQSFIDQEGLYSPDNFRGNKLDEVLKKRFEMLAVNQEYFLRFQQEQILEVCDSCIREEVMRDVRNSQFFSIIVEDAVDLAGEEHMPVFIRHTDDANDLHEVFVGFLPCEEDAEIMAVNFLTIITEKWKLNLEYCRGLSFFASSKFSSKMKIVAVRLLQMCPQATYTLCSSCALNIWLAKSIPISGVSVVLATLDDINLLVSKTPSLQDELENAITSVFMDNIGKANELKETLRSEWTSRHDTFEIIVTLLHSLVLCFGRVACDNASRWNTEITEQASMLFSALTDFDFIITIVILKNALSFTQAFGKNLHGLTYDIFSAANSLTAVLHALNEVMENIDVYHEFWFEEATNLAAKIDIPVKLPSRFRRIKHINLQPDRTSENLYKETLSIPTIQHIIQGLKDVFTEQHLKALKCLSIVPSVMGQLKFSTSEEHNLDLYKYDLPSPETLSAELNCWRVKWKHKNKVVELPSSIFESLHLPDIKFFPNIHTLLKVLCILPDFKVENEKYEIDRKRLRYYLESTPVDQRSSQLALVNISHDSKHDVDIMVDTYMKMVEDNITFESASPCLYIVGEVC
ncbi:52 kDa repressor of the inhibitor of the protein kinase-like isoform 2-T4 [Anomaloglossus baeobatrachus]|uniref:52 kDa repressor of the inhibitor of the protein kinase-like isoform X2 n=1 Tax=Anomaloglossus baeobatrachus TaxID=238106 RepID=UPI003F4FEC4F